MFNTIKNTKKKPISISFVIPVFNEEKRIKKTFEALNSFKAPKGISLKKVVFVDDGSTDKTYNMLTDYLQLVNASKTKYQTKIVSYRKNRGKGYAIRYGMKLTDTDYTLFFDADISTPLSELSKFVPFMDMDIDVIVGTRKNGHSTVIERQPILRESLGKVFTKVTNMALSIHATDITCGFKAFSKRAKDEIFSKCVINGWGYDAEILMLANQAQFSMFEKAVIWSNDPGTKVKLYKAIPQTLKELWIIRYNHSIRPSFATLRSSIVFEVPKVKLKINKWQVSQVK